MYLRYLMRVWINIYHANGCQRKARVAIIILHKLDIKTKTVTRDKEGHYIMTKGSIYQEDIIITYIPNIRAFKYIKQTIIELKRETVIP